MTSFRKAIFSYVLWRSLLAGVICGVIGVLIVNMLAPSTAGTSNASVGTILVFLWASNIGTFIAANVLANHMLKTNGISVKHFLENSIFMSILAVLATSITIVFTPFACFIAAFVVALSAPASPSHRVFLNR